MSKSLRLANRCSSSHLQWLGRRCNSLPMCLSVLLRGCLLFVRRLHAIIVAVINDDNAGNLRLFGMRKCVLREFRHEQSQQQAEARCKAQQRVKYAVITAASGICSSFAKRGSFTYEIVPPTNSEVHDVSECSSSNQEGFSEN